MVKRPIRNLLLILLPLLTAAGALNSGTPEAHPFAGITYFQLVHDDPPLREYWVKVDLTNPRIHLRVAAGGPAPEADVGQLEPWDCTLCPVSQIAQREHFDVAVNGSFFVPKDAIWIFLRKLPYFKGNWAREIGWAISDGRYLSQRPQNTNNPRLIVMRDGRVRIEFEQKMSFDAWQAVSGLAVLQDGRITCGVGPAAPRTAVGLDESGKTMVLYVCDGRRPSVSVGLSMRQLGERMRELGCADALNLDSGGSSTLVIRHGDSYPVINIPSDGHDFWIPLSVERPVANALGISVDAN